MSKESKILAGSVAILLVVFMGYVTIARLTSQASQCSTRQEILVWSIRPHPIVGAVGNRESICTDGSGISYHSMPEELEDADEVVFSPDGKRIAYSLLESTQTAVGYHIYIANADGSHTRELADARNERTQMAWSPDSRKLTFTGHMKAGFGIYVVDLACVEAGLNCELASQYLGEGIEPSWSPNAEKIVFVMDSDPRRGSSDYDIYVMNVDGSNRVNVTAGDFQDLTPAWSLDGQLIAFYSPSRKPRGVYLMKPDGSDLRFLTEGSMPVWSPDGESLAFVSERDNKGKSISIFDWNAPAQALYVMSRDGTKTKRLTFSDREYIKTFAWLPPER